MKAYWIVSTLICTAATVGLAAQDRSTTPTQNDRDKVVTMTGCVTRADMSFASGRLSTDGRAMTSGGDADKYLLSDARMTPPAQDSVKMLSSTCETK